MAKYNVRPKSRLLTFVKGIVVAGAIVGVGFASYSYWAIQNMLGSIQSPPPTNQQGEPTRPAKERLPDGPRTILVMGTDARGKEDSKMSRSDTMFVMRLDPQRKRATMMSIPRDMWVDIPGHGQSKINAAYFFGGGPLSKQVVEDLTGLTINYFFVVDWQAFKQFVDTIGPVKVYVPKDINDNLHNYRFIQGCQSLDGKHALWYVRFRHDERGDLGRIDRQQSFILQTLKQSMTLRNAPKIPRVMKIVSNNVLTDMPGSDMWEIGNLLRQIPRKQIETVTAPGNIGRASGQSVIFPDESEIQSMSSRMQEGLPAREPDAPSTSNNGTTTRTGGSTSATIRQSSRSTTTTTQVTDCY